MESLYNILEFFRTDTRPTLIVKPSKGSENAPVHYYNPAFESNFGKVADASGPFQDEPAYVLKRIVEASLSGGISYFDFRGLQWRAAPLVQGFIVVHLAKFRQDHGHERCAPKTLDGLLHGPVNEGILDGANRLGQGAVASKALAETQKDEGLFDPDLRDFPIGCAIFDVDAAVRFANQAYLDLAGSTVIDLHHGRLGEMIVLKDEDLLRRQLALLAAGDCPESFEIQVQRPWLTGAPGTSILVACTLKPGGRDKTTSLVVCLVDITPHKHLRDDDARRLEELLCHKKQSEHSADTVLHELKNTVSATLHSADTLADIAKYSREGEKEIRSAIRNVASTIKLCADHQGRIISDALILSRIDSHGLELVLRKDSPAALLERVAGIFSEEAGEAGVTLNTYVVRDRWDPDVTREAVLLDSDRVLQILINLVANAIESTRGYAQRCIDISLAATYARPVTTRQQVPYLPLQEHVERNHRSVAADKGDPIYLQFAVQDTGKGMTPSKMEKLFNRFSQVSDVQCDRSGLGLGLYIASCLTELHDGRICVSSEAGRGSTFAFYVHACRLRLCACSGTCVCRHPAAGGETVISSVSTPCSPFEHTIHCLIVDDNHIIRRTIAQQLQGLNVRISAASDGVEALSLINRSAVRYGTHISAVLMDLSMPVMDGSTCARKIRQLERSRKLRGHMLIIGVTSTVRQEEITNAIKQGIDIIVTKPICISEVVFHIKASIEKSKGRAI